MNGYHWEDGCASLSWSCWAVPCVWYTHTAQIQVHCSRNSWKKLVKPSEGLKLTNPRYFWETSMLMLGKMPVYRSMWLADMVMLTLMITDDSCCNRVITTHCASWTLYSSTEMCTSTPGADVLWVNGHSLIFCSGRNRRPCCPLMSNLLTSSWTAWPDGSGWWDNRMAAQPLPRNLVRPGSGLKGLAHTMKKNWSTTTFVV